MTRLVGPRETTGQWAVGDVTYDTEEAARAAARVLQDHGHGSPLVVPRDTPKFPTPWRTENGDVLDANGVRVFSAAFDIPGDLARLIADAVNEKYGDA